MTNDVVQKKHGGKVEVNTFLLNLVNIICLIRIEEKLRASLNIFILKN